MRWVVKELYTQAACWTMFHLLLTGLALDFGQKRIVLVPQWNYHYIAAQVPPDAARQLTRRGLHSGRHFDYFMQKLVTIGGETKTIKEWSRVVRRGGIIAIVHPDLEFTGTQLPASANPDKNPYNKHYVEKTYKQFLEFLKENNCFNLKLIDSGVACGNWSFYCIFKKVGFNS